MITIDSADKALKSYYLDVVSNSLNTKINPLLAKFEQTSADVWGKEVRKVVSNGINGGLPVPKRAICLRQANTIISKWCLPSKTCTAQSK